METAKPHDRNTLRWPTVVGSREPWLSRLLEIAVGVVCWALISLPIWGPLLVPLPAAIFILAFSVYWFYRSISVGILGAVSLRRIQEALRRDWLAEASQLPGWLRTRHLVIFPTYLEPVEVLAESLEYVERQDFPRSRV